MLLTPETLKRLYQIYEDSGISQKSFGYSIGHSRSSITEIFKGRTKTLSGATVKILELRYAVNFPRQTRICSSSFQAPLYKLKKKGSRKSLWPATANQARLNNRFSGKKGGAPPFARPGRFSLNPPNYRRAGNCCYRILDRKRPGVSKAGSRPAAQGDGVTSNPKFYLKTDISLPGCRAALNRLKTGGGQPPIVNIHIPHDLPGCIFSHISIN